MESHSDSVKNQESKVPLYKSPFNSKLKNCMSYRQKKLSEHNRISNDNNSSISASKCSSLLTIATSEDSVYGKMHQARKPTGYTGIANLPNQIYRKAVLKGFEFNIMVVGASGLGKSTFINSLFQSDVYNSYTKATAGSKSTVSIETTTLKLKEGAVNLSLRLVDTPGFGDLINNNEGWTPIVDFVEKKHDEFFRNESMINRNQIVDYRIHCCLYFIQPTGHCLKPLDIEFMKRLCDKVNIIPIIAKADTLTPEECLAFKQQILCDIQSNCIKIYEFPDFPEDDERYELNKTLKQRIPYAVVGSNITIQENGKTFRGRKYAWGVVNIENIKHCDFLALRKMLLSFHLQDLKDVTHNVLYENYRMRKLCDLKKEGKMSKNYFVEYEKEKLNHEAKLRRIEVELENILGEKVREKEKQLKDSKKILEIKYKVMESALEVERRELDENRKRFELEKKKWEESKMTRTFY